MKSNLYWSLGLDGANSETDLRREVSVAPRYFHSNTNLILNIIFYILLMRRSLKPSLRGIFVSAFLIIYTFIPPALAIDEIPVVDNSQDIQQTGVSDPSFIAEQPITETPKVENKITKFNVVPSLKGIVNAQVLTDKVDYSPTDTVVITGVGYDPLTDYTLVIYSNDNPAVKFETKVTTDKKGVFNYNYQLDGTYRSQYYIEVKTIGNITVATNSFKDSTLNGGKCVEPAAGKKLECTANDVSIANVTNIQILDDGCQSPTDTVTFKAIWDVQSNSSERYDIGLYFATQGQTSALNGICSVSTLPNAPVPPWYNFDGDFCGDISSGSQVHPEITLTVACSDPDGNNALNLPYCTSWDNNAGGVCSSPTDAIPGTGSKCNCQDGYQVPITVPYGANIEVIKQLVPTDDSGTFNLLVDNNTEKSCTTNNGTTGKVSVGAGTSVNPGATHTVGENTSSCGTTDLTNYDTTISCVDRGLTTFDGGAPLTALNAGPLNVNVNKDDDVVCTITNTRKTGHLIVQKTTLPSGNQTSFSVSASSSTGGTILNGASGTITDSTDHDYQVTTGTYSVTETPVTGWTQTGNTCNNVVVGANETKYCEITNTKLPTLTVNKILVPSNDSGSFDLKIDGTTYATGVGNNGTTGAQIVSVGNHTFSEDGTTLSNYNVIYGGDTGCNSNGTITLAAGENKTCTITNTAYGTLTIIKDAIPNNSQDFSFVTAGAGLSNFSLDDDSDPTLSNTKIFNHLMPGVYSVSEDSVTGWDLTNTTCSDQSLVNAINISAGETVTCTFTNTQRGSISGFKLNDNDGLDSTTNDRTGVPGWTIELLQNSIVIGSTLTANDGSFSFTNLVPGNYQLRESITVGWTKIYPTDDFLDVTLTPGETDSGNNFINVKYPTITVIKNVDTNGDGNIETFGATNWTWDIDGSGNYPTGSTVSNKMPGTYTISEDQQTNFHVTNLTCGTTNYGAVESQSITLTSGQDLTCTFTNTRDTGTLRVVKVVVNDNGGTLHEDDFSFSIDGGNAIPFEADGSNDLIKYAGGIDYDITEPTVNGYVTSYDNCTNVVVPKDGVATCTITNNDIGPSLTLIKTVTNDNGGDAIPSNWTLSATGPTTISGTGGVVSGNTFSAGTYTLSESAGPSGYNAGNWSCTGVTNIGNQITLGINQSAVCTINNDDIAPTLKLIKYVENNDGGNAVSADWTLYAQGSELGFSDLGNSTTFHTVKAGVTYNLSESTTPTGYIASWWDCNGGEHSGNTVKLGVGQNITCTITNYDTAPTITLIKSVTNNNGGTAGANDFGLTIGGTNVASGETLIVDSNTPIALDEAGLAGYAFVSMTGENCPRELGGTVTLNEGQNITCTITNDDIAPSLTLIKTVTNNSGGLATPFDWTLSATGTTTPISGLGGTTSGSTFKTGTYTLSESAGPSGYSAGDWSCTGVQNTGDEITLGLNQSAVCTINNDDIAPKLTLIKTVTTDNGGTKVVSDFPLFINLIPATSGIAYTLMANVQYTASETNLPGYTPSVWGGDCTEDGKITLQPGDNKACTITNDDQAGTLIVKKVLIKDNGGDETVTDFSFQVNGGTQTPFEADGQNNLTVNAGIYNIVEPHVDGYTTTYDNCSNVVVANGEIQTCTITNNDIAPTITLTKVVINDNGGTAGVNDFSLTTGGTGVTSGQKLDVSANTPIALNETVLTGYSFVSITGDEECPGVLNGTVTLDEGEDISCTITNNDQAPHLTLVKEVDNNYGGLATPTDWTLTATGPTTISGAGGVVSENTFSAGTYTLFESTGPSGYNAGDWNCIGIENDGDSITLGLGESATCTITNSDIQPKLKVIKHVITDNGGTAQASDFTMLVVDATNPTSSSFAGDENGTVIGLDAGSYAIDENDYFGYTKAIGDNCVGTIAIGEEKTCTITNDDQPGTIIIQKDVLNGEGIGDGVYSDTTFNVSLNNNIEDTQGIRDSQENPLTATFDGLSAGNYTVNEVVPDGFIFEGCYNGEPNSEENLNLIDESFTLGNGETLYLTCENQLVDPVLNITKTNNTGGADMVAGNNVLYTLTITAPITEPEENYVLKNVQVTDLLPAGFIYIPGTWTSTSSTTTDPLYTNGLGVWNLGTMTEGKTITLTYMAHISDTQAPGTYENIAWAKGTSLIDTLVLANANAEGGYFVTSSVKVVKTVEEGDVLGITDHVTLPNTGANTLLTITGITSMLLGFIILMLNPKKKIKMLGIAIVGILGIIPLILPLKTYAATEIIANISQPQTPTNQSSLNIAYSALDILGRNLDIQCYKTGTGAFGITHTTNSGYCDVTNSIIPADGIYEFYMIVTPEGGTPVTSNKVSVTIDRVGPSPVVGYTKTTNGCVNTLSFTTANDGGQTIGIQIFRSTTLSFTADDSTFIKLIAPVTSNQAITYQDTPPTCDKPYYYGIRAIDNAGNISASIGDKVVVTTILPPVVTPTQQGTVAGTETASNTTTPTNTNTGNTGTNTGTTSGGTETTNTNTSSTTTPQDTSGDVKGTTTQASNVWSWLKYVLIGIGVVALAGVVYMYVRNKNQENKIIK